MSSPSPIPTRSERPSTDLGVRMSVSDRAPAPKRAPAGPSRPRAERRTKRPRYEGGASDEEAEEEEGAYANRYAVGRFISGFYVWQHTLSESITCFLLYRYELDI